MFQVPAKTALKSVLLKVMMELGHSDVWRFKRLLQFTCFQKSLPELPVGALWPMNRTGRAADPGQEGPAGLVYQMVRRLGGESVGVAQEVLMDMNRTDVVQKLAGIRSGSAGWTLQGRIISMFKKLQIFMCSSFPFPSEFQSLLFQKVSAAL